MYLNNKILKTRQAFQDPKPGDLFREMGSYILLVTDRDGDQVTVQDSNGCTKKFNSVESFSKAYEYESRPGEYWLIYGGSAA